MQSLRAITFDLGWTLAYPRVSIWEAFGDICTAAGVPTTPEACEQLIRTLASATQEEAERQFHRGASYPDSDEEFVAMFTKMGQVIFGQLGLVDGHAGLMERFIQRFWDEENWNLFPEVIEVLGALRARGLKLGVLSNAPSTLPAFLDRLGLTPYLDFTVVSAIEGVKKPDRRIFAAALAQAGVAPAEGLHVGDMYFEDIVGGRAAGVNTLLIERGRRALFPSYHESEGRTIDPQMVVSDLAQMLDRIR
jgi:HAD superfamily hydrolase (TIGR01549 family)